MIKDIFRPEDFSAYDFVPLALDKFGTMASLANARFRSYLEENGKKVYGNPITNLHWSCDKWVEDTHTAYLIGVEELRTCEHPKEKVDELLTHIGVYKCACGAKLKPETFRAIGERDEVK